MTVADNIGFPLKMPGKPRDEIKTRVAETLEEVELSQFADRYPHELSGGQKQRVVFTRGLINQPPLLFLLIFFADPLNHGLYFFSPSGRSEW